MAYKVLTDGNGSKLIRVVGMGDYMPLSEFQRVGTERDAHAANTALVAKLNEYCQVNKIGDWGGSAVGSVIKRIETLQDQLDALRKAIIEYDDCDTAAQSKRACKAMVDLAKGVR